MDAAGMRIERQDTASAFLRQRSSTTSCTSSSEGGVRSPSLSRSDMELLVPVESCLLVPTVLPLSEWAILPPLKPMEFTRTVGDHRLATEAWAGTAREATEAMARKLVMVAAMEALVDTGTQAMELRADMAATAREAMTDMAHRVVMVIATAIMVDMAIRLAMVADMEEIVAAMATQAMVADMEEIVA